MPRKPNYGFERRERERVKAERRRKRQEVKAARSKKTKTEEAEKTGEQVEQEE
ncbi:MAG TPA: hypothetical protein QF509_07685 [Rhodospirillales bacterium]|jgi:hypothetical protein|nr:hypothetical protein [Rhodospirillales bacterium]